MKKIYSIYQRVKERSQEPLIVVLILAITIAIIMMGDTNFQKNEKTNIDVNNQMEMIGDLKNNIENRLKVLDKWSLLKIQRNQEKEKANTRKIQNPQEESLGLEEGQRPQEESENPSRIQQLQAFTKAREGQQEKVFALLEEKRLQEEKYALREEPQSLEEEIPEEVEEVEKVEEVKEVKEQVNQVIDIPEGEPLIVTMKVTAYCPESCCNGKWAWTTASGATMQLWHTVASGKAYPFGTKIYIPYFADQPNGGWFVVEDRFGGDAGPYQLDVLMENDDTCREFGTRNLEVYIYM